MTSTVPDVRHPGRWLAATLLLALALRWPHVYAPLQLDEFGTLYPVAERDAPPGLPPAAADPLVPVPRWSEVQRRSVLPYGITVPVPLYHYLLYLVVQVLPITEWSLRLPSVLAGLGCVAAMYWLARLWLGTGPALVAALLTAVDPLQIAASVIARPYALASLACVLSFVALTRLRFAGSWQIAFPAVLLYALAVALIGYLNAVLLLVGAVHLAVVLTGLLYRAPLRFALSWLAACALAGLLLLPYAGYLRQLQIFHQAHQAYLVLFFPPDLAAFVKHNSTFLIGLGLVTIIPVVARNPVSWRNRVSDPAPPKASPSNTELEWLAQLWFWLPQVLALAACVAGRSIFLSRYLSYTSLGGDLLLAYWISRLPGARLRGGLTATLAGAFFAWGFAEQSRGLELWSINTLGKGPVEQLDRLYDEGRWQPGDVVLYRPGFFEADMVPDQVLPENRECVNAALASPIHTLYVPRRRMPVICLSLSHRCGGLTTYAGAHYHPEQFYNDELADKLRSARRFWIVCHAWDCPVYLSCLLSWVAAETNSELTVQWTGRRSAGGLNIPVGTHPQPYDSALRHMVPEDSVLLILVQRK